MYLFLKRAVMMGLLALVAGLVTVRADTLTWTAANGDWFAVGNWTNWTAPASTHVPAAGDAVVVSNAGAYVFLNNSTPWLGALVISNATLSCSNWTTTIYATNLTIQKSGVLTCYGPFTNNAVSNRVNLTCTNLVIETGGSINVQGKGFAGGTNSTGGYPAGNGPGGAPWPSGGSYGGAGSYRNALVIGKVYGSATAPLYPGSGGAGGAYAWGPGGDGGGAVCITTAQVVVNGSINADAFPNTMPAYAGHQSGGSGGGIFITCTTIAGTNGTITASGGNGCQAYAADQGEAGGGGRIAVIYNTAAQAVQGQPIIRFVAAATLGSVVYGGCSDIGTLYFPDSFLFLPTNMPTGQWLAPGNLAVADLLASNVWLRLPGAGFSLTVTNTLSIIGTNILLTRLELTNTATIQCGAARLSCGALVLGGPTSGSTFNCAGDLTLTNSARLYVSAGLTNTAAPGYGALVSVGGDIRLHTNCWIYPAAHPTNGAPTLFTMRNLTVNTNSGFNADNLGYAGGAYPGDTAANVAYGPGGAANQTQYRAGSSYGGIGGNGMNGATVYPGSSVLYGDSNAPVYPGSGARQGVASSFNYVPSGGGSVQIRATKTVSFSGTVTANGQNGTAHAGGAASGGGIYITCRTFIGNSNAVLQAKGGIGNLNNATFGAGGGGGGGRIAVWRSIDKSPSVISNYVDGGGSLGYAIGSTGGPGTIVWGYLPGGRGTIITGY